MSFGEKKEIIFETVGAISIGSFCRIREVFEGRWVASRWNYCREFFHKDSHKVRKMLFSHRKNCGKNVAEFMSKIENLLSIEKKSKFGPTQRLTVMWIEPSSWWVDTSMKRSLFTALLRSGQNYLLKTDNFEEALFSHPYTSETKYAVTRFLAGYTKYTGRIRGWFRQFRWGIGGDWRNPNKPDEATVDKLLIKPKGIANGSKIRSKKS